MDLESFKNDIIKIYEEMKINSEFGTGGYPDHDKFQYYLTKLANKYELTFKTEYVGKRWFYKKTNKWRKGRIDIVYFKDGIPYISLEIDSHIKENSLQKLVNNDDFKYKIWFCYNESAGKSYEWEEIINRVDTKNNIIYLYKPN